MTFPRVKPAGWIPGEILTSAQMNQLDINVSRALDGTSPLDIPLNSLVNTSSRWAYVNASGLWRQDDITSAGELTFHLGLQVGGQLSAVHVVLDGGTGASHAALPATMPRFGLHKTSFTLGSGNISSAQIGSNAVDASANVAAYEVPHLVSLTGLTETISSTATYQVRFEGEAGANAVAVVLKLCKVYVVMSL